MKISKYQNITTNVYPNYSTIVIFSKSDIRHFWEWAAFENDNFNSQDLPTISIISTHNINNKKESTWKEPIIIEFGTKGLELRNQIFRSKEKMNLTE